jgi:AcrR family transcriptional regulator
VPAAPPAPGAPAGRPPNGAAPGTETSGGAARTRRERLRDATTAEIKAAARTLLVREGPAAVTLRATAREVGMTAPALYRYVDSHEDLLRSLCEDLMAELSRRLEAARDTVGLDDPVGRLMATCREFRAWGLEHPREFQLVFASAGDRSPPHHEVPGEDIAIGAVFFGVFVEIWSRAPFPVPPDDVLPPDLVAQLRTFAERVGTDLPLGVIAVFLNGWVRLYGSVTLEIFGHLGFALSDAGSLFESMLAGMRRDLTAAT